MITQVPSWKTLNFYSEGKMLCSKNGHTLTSCSIQWRLDDCPVKQQPCTYKLSHLDGLTVHSASKTRGIGGQDKQQLSWLWRGTVAMLACLHNPVQHVQLGFIPLDTQQQRCGHPCLRSQWSSTAQSDIILGISATSSVTTNLLFSSLHFTSMCFSYLRFQGVDDCSAVLFLVGFIYLFFLLILFLIFPGKASTDCVTPAQYLSIGGEHCMSFNLISLGHWTLE